MLTKQLFDSSRGRIVTLLRSRTMTADELASRLGLTPSAIRGHLMGMERDGIVQTAGQRAGVTRPSRVFELTESVHHLLSSAYIPMLTQLIDVFAAAMPERELDSLLRQAGRRLADELPAGKRDGGSLASRVAAASDLLNEQLGALTHVERNGKWVIRGVGCPLAAVTGKHPGVCRAMESLVAEIVGARVRECCARAGRPQCCFEIRPPQKVRTNRHRLREGRR